MKDKISQFISDVKSEFTWKGFLTVVGAFMLSTSIVGLHGVVKNQFNMPLSDAFGVEKSVIVLWESWSKVSGVITAALMGVIYKKLGPKLLAIFAGTTVFSGYMVIATTHSLPLLYFAGFLCGIGNACAGGLMFFTIIKPWWNKAFGTFSALCGTASGVGGVIFTQYITRAIVNINYQAGALRVAIFTIIISVIGGLLMSESPTDSLRNAEKAERAAKKRGETIKKEEKNEKDPAPVNGVPALGYKDFLSTPISWLCFVMVIMALYNVATSLFSPIAQWHGYPEPSIIGGAGLALYSFMLIWTKLGSGVMRDALGMRVVIPVMYIPAIIAICSNLFFTPSPEYYKITCAMMAFSGTATQLLVGYVSVQAFGKYFNTKMHAMTYSVFAGAGIIVPSFRFLPAEITGTYSTVLVIMLVFAVLQVAIAFICLKLGDNYRAKMDAKYGLTEAPKA